MAQRKKAAETEGLVGRLAERGEEATTRLLEAISKNPRVTDALARAMSGKGRLDTASRNALSRIGLSPVEDVKELTKKLERLERRVAKLEGAKAAAPARRTTTRRTTATRPQEPGSGGRRKAGGAT